MSRSPSMVVPELLSLTPLVAVSETSPPIVPSMVASMKARLAVSLIVSVVLSVVEAPRSSVVTTLLSLIAVVVFFVWAGVYQISDKLPKAPDTVSEPAAGAPQSEGDGNDSVDETTSR